MARSGAVSVAEVGVVAERTGVEMRRANAVLEHLQHADRATTMREPLVLAQFLEASMPLLRQLCRDHGVALEMELAEDVGTVMGDAGALQQVLLNLVRNAAEAILHGHVGGKIVIRLQGAGIEAAIAVVDDGPGFDVAIIERGHALFASDKPDGQGLGLLIVRRIIELHAGALTLANRPDGGAVAEIRLPLAMGAAHV
jgi:signal transduction histidine kinase